VTLVNPLTRRVVVTGMGMVSPLGCGAQLVWRRLLNSESGLRTIQGFQIDDLPAKVAGQIPMGTGEGEFDLDFAMPANERRRVGDFIVYAMAAARQAIEDSGWSPSSDEEYERTGVMVGSGIGGLVGITEGGLTMETKGVRRLSPFYIPSSLINLASGHISIRWGFKGPNHAVVTACSTGAHAIGDAGRMIQFGDADVMIAGGTEAAVSRIGIAGFAAARALSTGFNDEPSRASRPWDRDRDGFVMGEGAGVVVLEELEHAKRRGATIYAELVGYGMSGDAYHITAPPPDGNGGFRAMRAALARAQLSPDQVDYVNAHGTSTPLGDEIELRAVERMLGNGGQGVAMSSTKGATGHLLGAAGAIEAAFTCLAIRDQIAPPTINLDNPSVETALDLVPHKARPMEINVALSNSFGFGGTNASIVFKRAA